MTVLIFVFALVYSNVAANHAPKPHAVPIGVIGIPATVAAVTDGLARSSPGAYAVHAYSSVAAARTAILHRAVYGAYRPAPAPLLLVASASSTAVDVPPKNGMRSISIVRAPRRAALIAAELPAEPEPTTRTSKLLLMAS